MTTFLLLVCALSNCLAEGKVLLPAPPTPTVPAGSAAVNGTTLYSPLARRGGVVVLLHGNMGDRRHWGFQFRPLARKYKVVRYDMRGFGKSDLPNPDDAYSHHEDLKALLEYLGIEKAHVCGLSMGSGVAVDF